MDLRLLSIKFYDEVGIDLIFLDYDKIGYHSCAWVGSGCSFFFFFGIEQWSFLLHPLNEFLEPNTNSKVG